MPETCSMTEERGNRFQILCYEQVERLHRVLETAVPIHGRGNFPTLEIKLKDLILVVQTKLKSEGIHLRDVRLNGGAASYILGNDAVESYNDLDLIFGTKLNGQSDLQRIKDIVMQSLLDFLPRGVNKERMSGGSLNEAYVHKMVKIYTDSDRWSLISLSNARGRNVELKFADIMRRQFEFSVDSFQIILDSLLTFYDVARTTAHSPDSLPSLPASSPGENGSHTGPADKNNNRNNNNNNTEELSIEQLDSAIIAASRSPAPTISEHFYPTVVAESMYGSFDVALSHLNGKLISTRHPEEIRGGGLLKYCYLLARGYRPTRDCDVRLLERYMCSRFFIDFPDVNEQRSKLANYLADHFVGAEDADLLRHRYLRTLYAVVEESTVCLMGHERRQTLDLIRALADNVERLAYCRATGSRRFDPVAAANAGMYQPVLTGSPALNSYSSGGYPGPIDTTALYPSLDVTNANLIIDQVYYGPFTYPAPYPGGEPQQYYTVCTYEYAENGSPCGVSVSSSSTCASPSVGGPFSSSINTLGAELTCGLSVGGGSSCSSGVGSMGSPSCSGLSSPSCLSPAGSTLSCPYCESCDLSSDDGKELDRDDLVEVEDGLIS